MSCATPFQKLTDRVGINMISPNVKSYFTDRILRRSVRFWAEYPKRSLLFLPEG